MNNHPLPWRLKFGDGRGLEFIEDANGETVTSIGDHATAALIVRAVNAHDDLVLAAKEAVVVIGEIARLAELGLGKDETEPEPGSVIPRLMAAIAKAMP